jgi:agmatinase
LLRADPITLTLGASHLDLSRAREQRARERLVGPPTFATLPSFLGVSRANRDAAFVVAGIPLDIGTTNRAGTRDGPQAIRRASRMLTDGDHPTHWIEPATLDLADTGDFRIALGDIPANLRLIEQQAAGIPHLLALGGEHGITLPLLRALSGRLGQPLALVHFDAHVDTWPDNFGQAYAHGSVFYHAIEDGLVDPHRMIQIGIRSPVQRDVWDWTVNRGVTIVTAQDVHAGGVDAVVEKIRGVVGDSPAYLSFDIDCLDPAFAPGTGTPEIGGLATWQAQAILRRLRGVAFAGMDVVEVAPAYDVAEITALAAATVVWEYLALLGAGSHDRAADHTP